MASVIEGIKGEEMVTNERVDVIFASIVDTAAKERLSTRLLLSKLRERIEKELNDSEEMHPKKRIKESHAHESLQNNSTLQEMAFGVFLSHGIKYLSNAHLFPAFALLGSICKQAAERVLTDRCKERHPSLLAAVTNHGDNREATVSVADWRGFEQSEKESRQPANAWPAQVSDAIGDIDVLFEASIGDSIIWHGVAPLQDVGSSGGTNSLEASFKVPHWSFEAPLPTEHDSFSGPDSRFPRLTSY